MSYTSCLLLCPGSGWHPCDRHDPPPPRDKFRTCTRRSAPACFTVNHEEEQLAFRFDKSGSIQKPFLITLLKPVFKSGLQRVEC